MTIGIKVTMLLQVEASTKEESQGTVRVWSNK